jgi:hypothetical protein
MADAAARGRTQVRNREGQGLVLLVAWIAYEAAYGRSAPEALAIVGLVVLVQLVLSTASLRRRRHLDAGVLTRATASVRLREIAAFDPTQRVQRRPSAPLSGAIEVHRDGFVWGPRSQRSGAHAVFVPWSDVAEMNCLPTFFGMQHSCCFVMRDGRELLFLVSYPAEVELAVALFGVAVTGKPSRLVGIAREAQATGA